MEASKFITKFTGVVFKDISNQGFFKTWYSYITDSKYRTRVFLHKFLENQIIHPDKDLKIMADSFRQLSPKPDERIIEILKFVHKNVRYVDDRTNFNKIEYWAEAWETLLKGSGDCDDINSLIWVLARLSGMSPLQVWSAIGTTTIGGHYWLMYFSFKTDKWYSIDGTYYPDKRPINFRPVFKLSSTKYKIIWAIFNDLWSYRPK